MFTDHASGAKTERPELGRVLEQLRDGDTLVVWRLDRLGRSLRHLIDTVAALAERGVGFRSVTESIDTTTTGRRLVFHVFGALARSERELARERTLAGLQAARARGRMGGRPALMTADKTTTARRMYEQQELTVEQIARALGVSRSSIYRARNKTARSSTAASSSRECAPTIPAGVAGARGQRAVLVVRTAGVDGRPARRPGHDLAGAGPGGAPAGRRFCRGCAPTGAVDEVTRARCGDGPLLAGELTAMNLEVTAHVDAWLAAAGGAWPGRCAPSA